MDHPQPAGSPDHDHGDRHPGLRVPDLPPARGRRHVHSGAGTYGLMAAVMAGGAVIGGVVTASRVRPGAGAGRRRPRVGCHHPRRGTGPHLDAGTGRVGLRRLRDRHLQLHGQIDAAAGVDTGHPRAGDGSVGRGLGGNHPDRRTDRGLGCPGVRGPMVARGRGPADRPHRGNRVAGPAADQCAR